MLEPDLRIEVQKVANKYKLPAAFTQAIGDLLVVEGGLSDRPRSQDNGGLTKYGISQRSYPGLDIRNITLENAIIIYWDDFWSKMKLQLIPYSPANSKIASRVFDIGVNFGPIHGIKALQRALSYINPSTIQLTIDGKLGEKTLAAFKSAEKKRLAAMLQYVHAYMYVNMQANPAYKQANIGGWILRAMRPIL